MVCSQHRDRQNDQTWQIKKPFLNISEVTTFFDQESNGNAFPTHKQTDLLDFEDFDGTTIFEQKK